MQLFLVASRIGQSRRISAGESDPDLIVVRQVDIRMDAEQERQNRVRQQFRNESGRSRRGFSFADED